MTIQNRELWEARQNMQFTAENSPTDQYEIAVNINDAVNEAIDAVLKAFADNGIDADNADRCADLEAQIYSYLRESNPWLADQIALCEAYGEQNQ